MVRSGKFADVQLSLFALLWTQFGSTGVKDTFFTIAGESALEYHPVSPGVRETCQRQ